MQRDLKTADKTKGEIVHFLDERDNLLALITTKLNTLLFNISDKMLNFTDKLNKQKDFAD